MKQLMIWSTSQSLNKPVNTINYETGCLSASKNDYQPYQLNKIIDFISKREFL